MSKLPGLSEHDQLEARMDAALMALPTGSGRLLIDAMHAHREWVAEDYATPGDSSIERKKHRAYLRAMVAFLERVSEGRKRR